LLPASLWAASRQNSAGQDNSGSALAGVYELRVYHAAPGKLADLLTRFRDRSNTLIYILKHSSRDAATANWKAFQDDPEWKTVHEKSEANGKLVDKVDSTFMAMTDFSPPLR
jgi:NIPSNAP